jgi:hypothetical protein
LVSSINEVKNILSALDTIIKELENIGKKKNPLYRVTLCSKNSERPKILNSPPYSASSLVNILGLCFLRICVRSQTCVGV